ncbi:MAG: DUF2953 domain-containing protein [Sulfobacillus sp.]|nr:DUF2953 domain-containing protein [Sulfobacillus sp.]
MGWLLAAFGVVVLWLSVWWGFRLPIEIVVDAAGTHRQGRLTFTVRWGRVTWSEFWIWPSPHPLARRPAHILPMPRFNPERVWRLIRWAFRRLNRLQKALWERVTIDAFELQVEISAGDADRTAELLGGLWAFLSGWYAMRIIPRAERPPQLVIRPNWGSAGITGKFSSIIRLTPSDIMHAIWWSFWGHRQSGARRPPVSPPPP